MDDCPMPLPCTETGVLLRRVVRPAGAAAADAADLAEMFHEMATVGVAMLATLVVAWGVGTFLWDLIKYKKHKKQQAPKPISRPAKRDWRQVVTVSVFIIMQRY